jgi:hypothetical protein
VSPEETIIRLHTDPDFVANKRFDYSLEKLVERFPDGAPDKTIATALMISVEDVPRLYADVMAKLRSRIADPSL